MINVKYDNLNVSDDMDYIVVNNTHIATIHTNHTTGIFTVEFKINITTRPIKFSDYDRCVNELIIEFKKWLDGISCFNADAKEYTYSSTQETKCAVCSELKHTPLRVDEMGGYVCLTCIDKKLNNKLEVVDES